MTERNLADCRCGHPVSVHEAGECWWDTVADAETWDDRNQCRCDWYVPAEVTP